MKMKVRMESDPSRKLFPLNPPKVMKRKTANTEQAFTRLELIIVLITLALLGAIALPVLAGNKARSEQALCFSNLRQIGHAFHLWASDHADRNPWFTPT